MKQQEFRLGYSLYYQLFIRIGGIGMLLTGIYFLNLAFPSFHYLPIIIGCIFSVIGVMAFAESYSILSITSKGINQRNLMKEINLQKNEIEGFAEIPIKTSRRTYTELVIFSKDKKKLIKLDKDICGADYHNLINRLKQDYRIVDKEYKNWMLAKRQSRGKITGQVFGLLFSSIGYYQVSYMSLRTGESLYGLKILLVSIGVAIFLYSRYISKGTY